MNSVLQIEKEYICTSILLYKNIVFIFAYMYLILYQSKFNLLIVRNRVLFSFHPNYIEQSPFPVGRDNFSINFFIIT